MSELLVTQIQGGLDKKPERVWKDSRSVTEVSASGTFLTVSRIATAEMDGAQLPLPLQLDWKRPEEPFFLEEGRQNGFWPLSAQR